MKKNKIGVIADDFTGACDAASFLRKAGQNVTLYTKLPETFDPEADAYVIALKTRSVLPQQAVHETLTVLFALKALVQTVYFKYCSTFDSTPKGNIGPVCDALMENMNVPYTILAPSLPINGRTVKDGLLYVNGILLHESPLKDHPLNPMWDADIQVLMASQSKYPCHKVSMEQLCSKQIEKWKQESSHFYLIPDYVTDKDARQIASYFRGYPLLTGGSGLLEFLPSPKQKIQNPQKIQSEKTVILCGSCSQKTKEQIDYYRKNGGAFWAVSGQKLYEKEMDVSCIEKKLLDTNEPILIYSDAIDQDMSILRTQKHFLAHAKAIEQCMANLARFCIHHHVDRLVIGGGETSGAVLQALGITTFKVGNSIAPGVPALVPVYEKKPVFFLKSGNFGQEDFFVKALEDVYV